MEEEFKLVEVEINNTLERIGEKELGKSDIIKWIECICVVKFDPEIGQVIEHMIPYEALSKTDSKSLTLLAFPESYSLQNKDDHLFFFRFRQDKGIPLKATNHHKYWFGFSYFRQKKDKNCVRGFFQKSIVVVTQLFFINFYGDILQEIAKKYLETEDITILEEAILQSREWNPPFPGITSNCKLFTNEFSVSIPCDLCTYFPELSACFPHIQRSKSTRKIVSPTKFRKDSIEFIEHEHPEEENNTQKKFKDVKQVQVRIASPTLTQGGEKLISLLTECKLSYRFNEICVPCALKGQFILMLWNLWELMITETPILILGDQPAQAGQTVLMLISIIYPLKYTGDFRPYITIYDEDLKEYAEECKSRQFTPLVMGGSNPYFKKLFLNYPSILNLDKSYYDELGDPYPGEHELIPQAIEQRNKTLEHKILTLPPKSKCLMKRNKNILRQMKRGNDDPTHAINDWMIRKHFKEMTECFLSVVMDPKVQQQAIFKQNDFLKELKKRDSFFNKLYMKNSKFTYQLYAKFIQTASFRDYALNKMKKMGIKTTL